MQLLLPWSLVTVSWMSVPVLGDVDTCGNPSTDHKPGCLGQHADDGRILFAARAHRGHSRLDDESQKGTLRKLRNFGDHMNNGIERAKEKNDNSKEKLAAAKEKLQELREMGGEEFEKAKTKVKRLEEVAQKATDSGEDLENSLLEDEDESQTPRTLPEICQTWKKKDAESCIDKCYELEVARESGQATEEMWWDVGASLFDLGQLGGLIQEGQEVSAKKEEKIAVLGLIAGVGIVGNVIGSIGSAFVEEANAQENLNAQHCEQLSAVLMSRKLVSIEQNQDRMLGHIDRSIKMIAQVNQKLFKLEDTVKRMEERLTHQLQQNHLESLTTSFLQCVGTIQHGHAAAQGIMSDYLSIKKSFLSITKSGTEVARMAKSWLASMTKWEQDLPGRLDPIATSALDGLRCISSLLSHSDLLRMYLKGQLKSHMKATAQDKGWITSRDIMDYFVKMQLDTMQGMLTDDLLPLLDASVTQTRFILALAPRPGYWESFSLYLQSMNAQLSQFLVSGELHKFSQEVIRDVLDENTAQMFPVRASCLDALSMLSNMVVDTSKMTVWKISGEDLVVAERLSSMIVEPDKIDPRKGKYYYCKSDGRVGPRDFDYTDEHITGTSGFKRKWPDDPKAERMSMEQPWHCAARLFNQKSAAAEKYFSCLQTQEGSPSSCEPQLALTCPAEFAGAEFRCQLPGCSHAKLGLNIALPCTNYKGSIMTIYVKDGKAKCQKACLRIKSCGAVLYERSDNKCTLFPPGHDCKFKRNGGSWADSSFTTIIEG